jgi:hypothetical protein
MAITNTINTTDAVSSGACQHHKINQGDSYNIPVYLSTVEIQGGEEVLVPFTAERMFRARYQKRRNAQAVQNAFARLRKQWKADPAVTARVLCAEMGEFLQTDLTPLAEGVEETVYADRCTPETADRVYDAYLRAYRAWKPAQRRKRKADRAAAKAARNAGTVRSSA